MEGENENIPKIRREFPDNFRKIIFYEISPKSFSQGFLLIFKFSENCPKTNQEISRKIIVHEFHQKYFPEFYNFLKFSENFETTLVNVPFQFCLATESIGQDGYGGPELP